MNKKQTYFLLLIALVILAATITACETYAAGVTLEPREHASSQGIFFAGDWISEGGEWALVYMPIAHPKASEGFQLNKSGDEYSIGIDMLFKFPYHFWGNHLSVFPAFGADFRYFTPRPEYDSYDEKVEQYFFDCLGINIKAGVGVDFNFTKSFFLRAKAMYSPEMLSFMDGKPGFRLSMGLGYRTENDGVRKGFKSFSQIRIESAVKEAKENFDKKNYNGAVVNYRKAIELGAKLDNAGVANLSTALYERAKINRDEGNISEALDDMNASIRHSLFMPRQKYSDWLGLLESYEEKNSLDAPHGGYGKLIFPSNDSLTISYDLGENGQTNPNEIKGTGWNVNMPAGKRVFSLTYDEVHHSAGNLRSEAVRISLDVEDGHIYRAEGKVSGSQVTITITDVTNSELGKNYNISERPLFSRTLTLREERPRQESISINIRNNTGYTFTSNGAIWPSDGGGLSDLHIINIGGNLRNGVTRKITLPAVEISRPYSLMLTDTDGDHYIKRFITFSRDMTITFTIADIDLD